MTMVKRGNWKMPALCWKIEIVGRELTCWLSVK